MSRHWRKGSGHSQDTLRKGPGSDPGAELFGYRVTVTVTFSYVNSDPSLATARNT